MSRARLLRPRLLRALPVLALVGATLVPLPSSASPTRPAAAARPTVSVFPAPGTSYNSSRSEISFRGVDAAHVGRFSVDASVSGHHSGQLRPHSDGDGVSYVLATPFRDGETVTVKTGLDVRGGRGGAWRFRISVRAPFPNIPVPGAPVAPPLASYRTQPDLHPPVYTTQTPARGTVAGLTFSAPYGPANVQGVMISDDSDQPLYYRNTPGGGFDFRAQTLKGKPVLTYWQGSGVTLPGTGQGTFVVLDDHYNVVASVAALDGYAADIHDFTITRKGTAIMTVYVPVTLDTRSVGGNARTRVMDSVFQEIDLDSGRMLFEWHSLDHIDLSESYNAAPQDERTYWDYTHINSAHLYGDGAFLVSLRATHAIVKIDRASAGVVWRLGGKRGDFRQGPGAAFHSQHDVVPHGDGTITMFDNATGVGPSAATQSRGLSLRLDSKAMTSTVVEQLSEPGGLLAPSQGNFEQLPNGRGLVGYGAASAYVEYAGDGSVLHDVRLGLGVFSYRVRKNTWTATPTDPPAVVATRAGAGVQVFASWNGATEVRAWRVLAGRAASALTVTGTAPRSGFETQLGAPGGSKAVQVQALDDKDAVIGTSAVVAVG